MEEKIEESLVELGIAELTLPGQRESGDRHVVVPFLGGVLLAVVDGLGHGEGAATAAKRAIDVVQNHPQETLINLVRLCHQTLIGTRGVVMSLASFNRVDNTMIWLGIGNVQGILLHRDVSGKEIREMLTLRGGVLGDYLPNLYAGMLPVTRGDTLIFATDGIHNDFADRLSTSDNVQRTAGDILTHFAKGTDDGLVLVARYLGP
jgi:phosphoserine phosphatase RsbX